MATEQKKRIYIAKRIDNDTRRLIRATHPSVVARYLASEWDITAPTQDELIELGAIQQPIEDATDNGNPSN